MIISFPCRNDAKWIKYMMTNNYIPDWNTSETGIDWSKDMAAPTNRQDIVDDIKYIPSNFFNLILLYTLKIDTSAYQNVRPVNDLKDKIKNYLGFNWVNDHYEPRPELNKDAKEEVQSLIDIYNTF
jgi:hypothetical protein